MAERAFRIEPVYAGQTVAILATGPSLSEADAWRVHALKVIAISDALRLPPRADVLYSSDARWWDHHQPFFYGLKLGLAPAPAFPGVFTLRPDTESVFSDDPTALATGRGGDGYAHYNSSGYQAINLAVLLGAKRILLLGYDLRVADGKHHFFGDHPRAFGQADHYASMRGAFIKLPQALAARGVEVINCTPGSALDYFPKLPLEQAFG